MQRKKDHLKLVKKKKEGPVWKKITRFLVRLALILGFLFLIYQVEPFFRISEVKVQGAEEVEKDDIINAAEINRGMSIIFFRDKHIIARIQEQLPRVKQVEINRNLPDTVVIKIDERKPAAYVMADNCFWPIDVQAVCLGCSDQPAEHLPLVVGIEGEMFVPGFPIDCRDRRESLKSLFLYLSGEDALDIKKIEMAESYNLVVYTVDGLEIWLGKGEDLDYKLDLIKKSIPFIDPTAEARLDVRCGKRVVVSGSAVSPKQEGVDP